MKYTWFFSITIVMICLQNNVYANTLLDLSVPDSVGEKNPKTFLCEEESSARKYIATMENVPKNPALTFYIQSAIQNFEKIGNQMIPGGGKEKGLVPKEVEVEIVIKSNGELCGIRILRQSYSSENILQIIKATINRVNRFPPFPDSVKREYDTIHLIRSWFYRYD